MPVPAIVTAGDRGAARAVRGESKVYLEIDGRPLVSHVVAELQRVPEVSEVYVVGNRERLDAVLSAPELQAELRKPLRVLEQWNNLYENAWQGFRHSLPGAGEEGRDPESEAELDHQVLYLSADLPFVTAQEISQFVREGIETGASYVIGLSREESLVPVGLSPGPGASAEDERNALPITYFNLREGRFKQNNLHLARPARMGNRHYIEDMYEHRKQRKLTNMIGLLWRILSSAEGSFSIVFFLGLIQLAGVADRRGYRGLADVLRRISSIERVRRGIGQLLDTSMAFAYPSVGGCAVDVDDELEFDTISRHYDGWRKRVVERAEAEAGALPLPARSGVTAAASPPTRFVLADRERVEVSGRDRHRWLGGMVSNEVAGLEAGQACPALVLTHKGRVVAQVQVLAREDALWLECAAKAAGPMIEQLQKSIVADDVELRAAGSDTLRVAIEGPGAEASAAELFPGLALPGPDACCEAALAGVSGVLACYALAADEGFQWIAPDATSDDRAAIAAALGDAVGDDAALDAVRIRSGRPGHESEAAGALPAEVGLGFAIAPDKGCYTGQEVVAKLQSRARVNRLLVCGVAELEGSLELPAALEVDGREVGQLTSLADAGSERPALAIVRREHAEAGREFALPGGRLRLTGTAPGIELDAAEE